MTMAMRQQKERVESAVFRRITRGRKGGGHERKSLFVGDGNSENNNGTFGDILEAETTSDTTLVYSI